MKHRTITRSGDRTAQSSEFNVPAPRLRPSVHAVRHALRGIAAIAALQFATPAAFALPIGEDVKFGTVTFDRTTPDQLNMKQTTPTAGVNWTSFSILKPEAVNVQQLDTNSVMLNRVVGSDPSQIFGALNANGKVFLVNPNGILFAPGASVNVGGLVGSTLDITDANFQAGTYQFDRVVGSAAGAVVNQADIAITVPGSYGALIGTNVSNEGKISVISTTIAGRGAVALAAGDRVTLNIVGDNLINVSVDAAALGASVLNKVGAEIIANGGQVFLTARSADALLGTVINMDGLIRANTLTTGENGTIVLDAGSHRVSVAGAIEAKGTDPGTNGGAVNVTGREIILASSASIDVSGVVTGGTVGFAIGTADGASGNLTIGSGTTLQGGTFTVTGNAGTDTITVARDADMTLTDATLTVGTAYTLGLTSIEAANLTGGAGDNAITASAFTGAVTVNATAGTDTVTGNGGNTTFVGLNALSTWDTTNTNAGTYTSGGDTTTLTDVAHWQGGNASDTFNLAHSVASVAGGDGSNSFNVSAPITSNLTGGADQDSFTLSGTGNVTGTIDGAGGTNTLTGNNLDSTWSIATPNTGSVTDAHGSNAFTNIQNLTGGTQADSFAITGTGTVGAIDGGGGVNSLSVTRDVATITLTDTQLALGADTTTLANIGQASLTGGVGDNTITASGFTGTVTVNATAGHDTVTGNGGNTTFVGTIADSNWDVTGANAATYTSNLDQTTLTGVGHLVGGTGADTFTLATGVTTFNGSIAGGGGIDTLAATDGTNSWEITGANAGKLNTDTTFSAITKLVGGTGSDTLTGVAAGSSWSITGANAVTVSGMDASAMEHLVGGTGNDSFTLATGVTTFNGSIAGGGGIDTLAATDGTNSWEITGANAGKLNTDTTFSAITKLVGGTGSDTLTGVAAGSSWSITGANAVTVSGMDASAMEHLVGGTGADTFTLAGGVTTFNGTIDGGGLAGLNTLAATDGTNDWNVSGSRAGTLNGSTTFSNIDTLSGGTGSDTLTGVAAGSSWSITGQNAVTVSNMNATGIEHLVGGTGADTFTLAGGVTTFNGTIDGGGLAGLNTLAATDGTNDWNVSGSRAGTLNGSTTFSNIDTLSGGTGSDTLTGVAAGSSWSITGQNAVTVSNMNATGIEHLVGGTGADTFTLAGGVTTFNGTIDGGGLAGLNTLAATDGTNDWNVSGSRAGTLNGSTTFSNIDTLSGGTGSDTLTGVAAGSSWSITGQNAVTVSNMNATGIEHLVGGTGADTFTLAGGVATFIGTIDGGGGTGKDTLAATDGSNAWLIDGSDSGKLNTTTTFTRIANLTGGSGADTFTFDTAGILTGRIDGGDGPDSANYSASLAVSTVTLGTDVVNVETLTGATGQTLAGADILNSWLITGDKAGIVNDGDGIGLVNFSGFDALRGGTKVDTFTLDVGVTTFNGTIDGGGLAGLNTLAATDGTNDWNVSGSRAGTLNGSTTFSNIDTLSGGTGSDTLTGVAAGSSWSITGQNAVTVSNMNATGIEHLVGGTGADTFTLAGGVTTFNGTIDGGGLAGLNTLAATDGTNDWNVSGSRAGTLNGSTTFSNIDTLSGGTGSDTLTGVAAGSSWSITGQNAVTVSNMNATGIEHLVGGTGADTFTLAGGVTTFNGTIDGGGLAGLNTLAATDGTNDWNVSGSRAGTLNGSTTFSNIDTLSGGTGSDTLTGVAAGSSWSITGQNAVTVSNMNATGIEHLVGGTGADTFTLTGGVTTFNGTIDGGAGPGQNTLAATDGINAWVIDAANSGNLNTTTTFSRIDKLAGGTGSDSLAASGNWTITGPNAVSVAGISATSMEALFGGAGVDTFTLAAGVTTFNGSIDGGGGSNTLAATDGTNAWVVGGPNSGTLNVSTTFSNIGSLVGGSGGDNFAIKNPGTIGSIDGGAGTLDTLDLSAKVGAVSINTVAHTATGVGSFANIESVVGNSTSGTTTTLTGRDFTLLGTNSGAADAIGYSGVGNLQGVAGANSFAGNGGSVAGTISDGGGGTTQLSGTIMSGGAQTYTSAIAASTVTLNAGGSSITATNSANDFTETLTVTGGTVKVTDANALMVQLSTTGDTYILANAAGGTGDLTIGGSSGNLIAVTNGGGLAWNTLTAPNAILIAATPVISGVAKPADVTGPGSKGNAVDDLAVTYINRNDARAMGDLTIGNQFVLVARDAPKVDANSAVQAGSAVFNIAHLVPANRLRVVLTDSTGTLRLLASEGEFRFRAGSGFAGGVTTLNPNAVGVFIADVPISSTRDQLASRAAVSAAQQSALNSASSDARQSFGTDSVTQQIDMGFAGDVGIAPTMAHNVPLQGEIISTPEGVTESKGGEITGTPPKCNPDPKTGECK